jgi:hypothetical protein
VPDLNHVAAAYERSTERCQDDAEAVRYIECRCGITAGEFSEGVANAELSTAAAELGARGAGALPSVLFSSFLAGIEFEKTRAGRA